MPPAPQKSTKQPPAQKYPVSRPHSFFSVTLSYPPMPDDCFTCFAFYQLSFLFSLLLRLLFSLLPSHSYFVIVHIPFIWPHVWCYIIKYSTT